MYTLQLSEEELTVLNQALWLTVIERNKFMNHIALKDSLNPAGEPFTTKQIQTAHDRLLLTEQLADRASNLRKG